MDTSAWTFAIDHSSCKFQLKLKTREILKKTYFWYTAHKEYGPSKISKRLPMSTKFRSFLDFPKAGYIVSPNIAIIIKLHFSFFIRTVSNSSPYFSQLPSIHFICIHSLVFFLCCKVSILAAKLNELLHNAF